MDFEEKKVDELTNRIANFIGEEFENTRDLGPLNHFMAFRNVVMTSLIFFDSFMTKDGIIKALDGIKEEFLEMRDIVREEMEKKKKYN